MRRPRAALRLEALEDRLAPHCTLLAVAQAGLPFGIPAVACAVDDPAASPASAVFTTDIAGLGFQDASQLTVVFQVAQALVPTPVLEYLDEASATWRPARASTRVSGALAVDVAEGTITLVFDDTSTPALASLNGRRFRLSDGGVLLSLALATSVSPAAAAPRPAAATRPVSGFFDPAEVRSEQFVLDTRGGVALTPAELAPESDAVIRTHAAFWGEADAGKPVDSDDTVPDPIPPVERTVPDDAVLVAQVRQRDGLPTSISGADEPKPGTPTASESGNPTASLARIADPSESCGADWQSILRNDAVVGRSRSECAPNCLLFVAIAFGCLRGQCDEGVARRRAPIARPPPAVYESGTTRQKGRQPSLPFVV